MRDVKKKVVSETTGIEKEEDSKFWADRCAAVGLLEVQRTEQVNKFKKKLAENESEQGRLKNTSDLAENSSITVSERLENLDHQHDLIQSELNVIQAAIREIPTLKAEYNRRFHEALFRELPQSAGMIRAEFEREYENLHRDIQALNVLTRRQSLINMKLGHDKLRLDYQRSASYLKVPLDTLPGPLAIPCRLEPLSQFLEDVTAEKKTLPIKG